ncbi:CIC11C00000002617 [Sungouiella intermedia]|uniref:CIC11C00000002617 n=1 Tax=Sungouiella intermedia TaxID=45354 RepID=A0A1L0BRT6_9ASCO|nr:CIC11C00000002617 [[Candida] intermedia]
MVLVFCILLRVACAIITGNLQLEIVDTGFNNGVVEAMAWSADFQIGSENEQISLYLDFYSNWNYLPLKILPCNSPKSGANYLPYPCAKPKNYSCFSTIYDVAKLSSLKLGCNNTLYDMLITDKLAIGGYGVGDVDFIAVEKDANFGILALGQPDIGTYLGYHKNFVQQLKQRGVIESSVLSLWVNPGNTTQGQFAIGGIDETKYNGSIYRFPMLNSFPFLKHSMALEVKLDSMIVSKFTFSQPLGMVLNPNFVESTFPKSYLQAFAKAYGGKLVEIDGTYRCAMNRKYLTLNEISKANAWDSEFINATSNLDFILLASGASDTSLAFLYPLEDLGTALYTWIDEVASGTLSGSAALAGPLLGLLGIVAGIFMAI